MMLVEIDAAAVVGVILGKNDGENGIEIKQGNDIEYGINKCCPNEESRRAKENTYDAKFRI